jgi:hypothetical protein
MILSATPAPSSATLTFRGQVTNGLFTGSIVELGATFSAVIDPPAGATAAMAGYYTAPATNTATGAIYSIVGTEGRIFVLVVTPDFVTSGNGSVSATGLVGVTTDSAAILSGQIDPVSTTLVGTVVTSGDVAIDFAGVKTSTLPTDRLINLSARGSVSSSQRLIAGFVIGGTQSKQVLLRAVGPALSTLGVTQTLTDPKLQLFNAQGQVILENDNWSGTNTAQVAARIGAFSLGTNSRDSALLTTLQPGVYTMHVLSNDGSAGVALAEIYDASENPAAIAERLVNISSRAVVGTGENVLINGFVVTGNSPKRLLIRGVGPSLVKQGVSPVVADPMLRIYDRHQTVVATNNDWGTPLAAAEGQTVATAEQISTGGGEVGAFALNSASKDAAAIVTLSPGIYTVVLSDNTGVGGTALVEIYEMW